MSNKKQQQQPPTQTEAQLIKETLTNMEGGRYSYGGKLHVIKSFLISEEKETVQIQTDKRYFDRPLESAMELLNHFEPIQEMGMQTIAADDALVPVMQINSEVISQLKDILLDNIKKVREDKGFIPQATAVKLNVDSVIDLAKIEVAYMEAYVRMRKAN
jgi:PP-loop superfamily ATP-utilizing enzyme